MKILVVQLGFLGDVILSSAVFENIKDLYPESEIYALTTPESKTLYSHNPDIKEVITYAKRKEDKGIFGFFRIVKLLKDRNFNIVFSLHKSFRTSLLLYCSGITKRYGFSESSLSFLYTKTSPRKDLEHDVLRNLAIFRNIDKEPSELKQNLKLSLSKKDLEESKDYLKDFSDEVVGLAPGSVWKTKKWTEDGFAKLSDLLSNEGYKVVLVGGPSDKDAADKIYKLSNSKPLNLVSKTSLGVSAALISNFKLLVSNDSAPQHMASALGVPLVSIFCATVPEFGYGPWEVSHRVSEVKGLECRPCGRHGLNHCPAKHFRCAKDLTAEKVFNDSMALLKPDFKLSKRI